MIELEFFGAAGEVTGSCHVLTVGSHKILLDCGMIQGGRKNEVRNRDPFPFDPETVDVVVLSHAHIDHSGRLPLLVKRGFKGPIHTHSASVELASILLADAAYIAASAARRENRRLEKAKKPLVKPLYSAEDAGAVVEQLVGHRYQTAFEPIPGVSVRLLDAGHIMGSAVVEVHITADGVDRTLIFSGDLGQYDTPILHDPQSPKHADLVLMETTYGDRRHRDRSHTLTELSEVIAEAHGQNGNILIPAFAVGRSQEILYQLGKHYEAWGLGDWQVYLDSPLAIKTSRIYWDYPHLYDDEATTLRRDTKPMPMLGNLSMSVTADESRAINDVKDHAIIIAGSGMLNGGRILHHLKQRIEQESTHILFTGYQPPGSLGRRIMANADKGESESNRKPTPVRIHGESLDVAASVHTIGGMSAHGDNADLLDWYRRIDGRPPVYCVHGDLDAAQAFRHKLANEAGAKAYQATPGLRIDLATLKQKK